jgi:KDO2-lipid IV(A) lauroyltransferase
MYYLVYGLLYLVSLLPLRVLFVVSDFAFVVIYYLVGYRKKVVMANLAQAFPEKTEQERKRIARRFYRNFTDNFIEFIKLISASPEFIDRHFSGDYSLIHEVFAQGKKCELLLAHNFNWELACLAVPRQIRYRVIVVYMPIGSKVLDRIFMKTRSKTGGILIPSNDMRNAMMPYRNQQHMLVLVADQNPGNPARAYWVNFLNKPTPFVRGPESGARRGDTLVLFCKFIKEKRGHYRIIFEMGCENPEKLAPGQLTRMYVNYLEQFIRDYPDMWLWSHRRWKHEWKKEYGPVLT